MRFTPLRGIREFANSFKEWHYLAGGFCFGFQVGFLYGFVLSTVIFIVAGFVV